MPGIKDRYAEFCRQTYVPLHLQPWWLDAVCGPDAWQVALAGENHDRAEGAWPYFRARRWGLPVIQQPPLTAYAGPWLREVPEEQLHWKRLSREHRLLEQLIRQLPRVMFLHQTFRPEIQNALPFHWAGFQQTLRYTYVLPEPRDRESLWQGFKDTLRTELRHAAKTTTTEQTADWRLLTRLNALSYAHHSKRQPFRTQTFERLYNALSERNQTISWVSRDRRGVALAGLALAFDARQAGVLLAGRDPNDPERGALHTLYEQAAVFCAGKGLTLDFEGSMHPGIGRVFRAFGAVPKPYFRVWRAANKWLDRFYQP